MASNGTNGTDSQLLVVCDTGGVTVVDPSTPLRRLNYFDGKFLRAADFSQEQYYLRELVALSNQGLGWGVVYGYDTILGSGDNIQIGPGLAIDPAGNVLLMQATVTQSIQALIDASKKSAPAAPDASGKAGPGTFSDCVTVAAPPPTTVVAVSDLYLIAICSAEALCGQADVYGQLCQEACVTSTDRPYRLDGIVLKAIPLQLITPFPTSKAVAIDADLYLRAKVAYSFYRDEVAKHPSAISRDGLLSNTWCLGAGYDSSCCEVPLAVVARSGATTVFLDAWIARRERTDAPARRYWQWKMMMRPWNVFLAQVLQFQCQLGEVLSGFAAQAAPGPAAPQNQALGDALKFLDDVRVGLSAAAGQVTAAGAAFRPLPAGLTFTRIAELKSRFEGILQTATVAAALPTDRILIRGGIIELPSSGYLPVVNGTNATPVNAQVRALLGEGLDLRFCIVTADYVAHVFEEAQHMDRISLLQGIDDPTNKPRVDILVPDGNAITTGISPDAKLYDAAGTFSLTQSGGLVLDGAAREESLPAAGTAFYFGGAELSQGIVTKFDQVFRPVADAGGSLTGMQLNPDLHTSDFIRNNPKLSPEFSSRLRRVAAAARTTMVAAAAPGRKEGTIESPPSSALLPGQDSVEGVWMTGRTERSIKDLDVFAQTPVSFRVIAATHPSRPTALELTVNGTLTAIDRVPATSTSPLMVRTSVNVAVTYAEIISQPAREEERETILTTKYNLNATFSYDGDDFNGSITMDVFDPAHPDPKDPTRPGFRVRKNYLTSPSSIEYAGYLDANEQLIQFVDLNLTGDSDVLNLDNHYHQLADDGLDLVQAAIFETEPSFKKTAESELFPQLPPATVELTIQPVRDWVLFTKRREETCTAEVAPVPPPPPRSYRVVNLAVPSQEEAQRLANELKKILPYPSELAGVLNKIIDNQPPLIVKFAGASATALSDLVAVEKDWKNFNPGDIIYLAAAGASGEDDQSLQIRRTQTVEGAIATDCKEDPKAIEMALLPFPPGVNTAGADGIMLFVTASTELQHVYATDSGDSWQTLQTAIKNGTLVVGTLSQILTDLGGASSKVAVAGHPIDDATVVNNFKNSAMSGENVDQSTMISRQGDSDVAYSNRVALASKIVSDLDSTASAPVASIYTAQFPITNANSILFVKTVQQADLQHVYATTNRQAWDLLQREIQNGSLSGSTLGTLELTDLGVASSTGTGAGQKIVDTAVVNAFGQGGFSGSNLIISEMISRLGDSNEAFNNRTKIADQIVSDIFGATASSPPPSVYQASQFPIGDANSMLFLLVSAPPE